MTTFYREIIGLEILDKKDGRVELAAGGKTPLLVLRTSETVHPKHPRRTGLYHFALLLPSRADLGTAVRHLSRHGIPIGAADHLVSEAVYLEDPEGNGIEIYRDLPPDQWKWDGAEVRMATEPLDLPAVLAAADAKWEGMPPDTVMGHIHLHVSDLEEARRFYGDGLGFKVVSHYPQALFMSDSGYHHHIGLNTWNGKGVLPQGPDSAGLAAFTVVFPNDTTRSAAAGRLRSLGWEPSGAGDRMTVSDPSGNRILLA
ncbi:catechol 2,3-dioxygenase [Bhargavaea ullalensis]|uniref:Catechol 2,3-dioxygenase n=2 Tax=Bhargavaea ullalensis TaxID=1265685 RepID=A0ABV2GB30_9BACL